MFCVSFCTVRFVALLFDARINIDIIDEFIVVVVVVCIIVSPSISSHKRLQLSKRTSSAAHLDGDDDIDSFGDADFGNFNEYTDSNTDHIDIMDRGANVQPPTPSKSLTTKFMMRGMRGQRQYDVPQIGKFFFFKTLTWLYAVVTVLHLISVVGTSSSSSFFFHVVMPVDCHCDQFACMSRRIK